jgi:putative SOS response-associated peptidase YedK
MTTSAGDDIGSIHDRMPAILDRGALAAWLQPGVPGHHRSDTLLRPAPGGTLVRHPVNPRVGDVRNDAPGLIEPFEPPAEPLRLFG